MTHYMELLMQNSPWNLLLFMALPVVLAETIAITELILLLKRTSMPVVETINRIAGVLAGIVFAVIIVYLIPTVVVPLTQTHQWRTWIDVFAVGSYLISGIPMILIALMHLGVILRSQTPQARQSFHVACVAIFLIVGHLAMIAGMADPAIAGWQGGEMAGMHGSMTMPSDNGSVEAPMMHSMPMDHSHMNHGNMQMQ